MMRWYRGPWNESPHPFFKRGVMYSPPEGMDVGIDLRVDSSASGLGIFCGPGVLGSEYDLLGTGHPSEIPTTVVSRDAIPHPHRFAPSGATLADVIWDVLTRGTDPVGEAFVKPLMPNNKGQLRLLANVEMKRERFRFGDHAHTEKVRDVVSRGVQQTRELNERLARKNLGYQLAKYGLKDEVAAQFSDLRPIKPETSFTDDFNRSNRALTSDADWDAWGGDVGLGSLQIVSNRLKTDFGGARYATAMSGADMESEITVASYTSGAGSMLAGPSIRSTTGSGYNGFANILTGTHIDLNLNLSSSLGTYSFGAVPSMPLLLGIVADGSDITCYANGVSRIAVTNTNNPTNLYGAVLQIDTGHELDDYYVADLGAEPEPPAINSLLLRRRRLAL